MIALPRPHRTGLVVLFAAALAMPAAAQKAIPSFDVPVVGFGQKTTIVPDLAQAVPSGEQFAWVATVVEPSAGFLKAHLVDVNLAAGDTLTVRSRSGKVVETITGRGPKGMGSFWSLSAFGDVMHLELLFGAPYERLPFRVDEILIGNQDMFAPAEPTESVCSPEHFDDAICFDSDADKWDSVLASVGVMSVGGSPTTALFCSGSNVSPQNYVLTNYHCISSQGGCDASEFVFKYYRTGCNDGSPATTDWQGFHCDQLVASSPVGSCDAGLADQDYSLHSIVGDAAASFGFAQPDPVPLTDGEDIYIVQHPAGRPHELTHGGGEDVDVDGTVLRYYDTLDTEGGSSGSPIFREADDKLVGLHHCGGCSTPGTGNRGMLMSNIIPEISEFLCSDVAELVDAGAGDLTEVVGNGNLVVEPGETWSFVPRLANAACEADAVGVTAELVVTVNGAGTVHLLDPVADFGTIAAASTASADAVRFYVGPDVLCGTDLDFHLTNVQSLGGGFPDSNDVFAAPVGDSPFISTLSEDWSAGQGAWTVADQGTGTGPASTWTLDNPGNRSLPLSGPFMIADSDALGPGFVMDERLVTPLLDLSTAVGVTLQFNHDFDWFEGGGDERGDVDVRSSATGGAWTTLHTFAGEDASGVFSIDATALAAGQSDVRFRFRYHQADFDWWWAVDDVFVLTTEGYVCEPGGPWYDLGQALDGSAGTPLALGTGTLLANDPVSVSISNLPAGSETVLVYSGIHLAEPFLGGLMVPKPEFLVPVTAVAGSAVVADTWPAGVPPGISIWFQWWTFDLGAPLGMSASNGLSATSP